jgi:hypothetical protein
MQVLPSAPDAAFGPVMRHSNLPYRYWFVAMHLLTATKGSFSAAEIQRQLGHKRYQPIWVYVFKLKFTTTA